MTHSRRETTLRLVEVRVELSASRRTLARALSILSLTLGGCHMFHKHRYPRGQKTPEYVPRQARYSSFAFDGGFAVLPFTDIRSMSGDPILNWKWLALIPGVPWANLYTTQPERTELDYSSTLYGLDPGTFLAEAFRAEIVASKVFSRGPDDPTKARYLLKGTIEDLHLSEGYLTYGISVASVVPHLLDFPEGTLRVSLTVKLELIDRQTGSPTSVWQYALGGSGGGLGFCFTWIWESDEAAHANWIISDILREEIPRAVDNLRSRAGAVDPQEPEPGGDSPPPPPPPDGFERGPALVEVFQVDTPADFENLPARPFATGEWKRDLTRDDTGPIPGLKGGDGIGYHVARISFFLHCEEAGRYSFLLSGGWVGASGYDKVARLVVDGGNLITVGTNRKRQESVELAQGFHPVELLVAGQGESTGQFSLELMRPRETNPRPVQNKDLFRRRGKSDR
jgi:hypothetical protein